MRGTAAEAATYGARVDEQIVAKLAGRSADKTLLEATAPQERTPRNQTEIDPKRAGLIVQAIELLHGLDIDDLRVRVAMLEQGSFEQVKVRCEEITASASEPAGTPNNYRSTPHEHTAIGEHLSTLRAWRLIVLGPGRRDR